MAEKRRQPGPSGARVAANLRRLRLEAGLTTAEVSRRMSAAGQPVLDTGVIKTEKDDRRVDVDELVAFAVILGCSPNLLLLPRLPPRGIPADCELTPGQPSVDAAAAWAWATGEKPLPNGESSRGEAEFVTANRPQHFGGGHWRLGQGVTVAYAAAEAKLSDAIHGALEAGVTTAELRSIFEQALVRALAERDE
jgi:transcriptional regulator with XRE-family HTH domain